MKKLYAIAAAMLLSVFASSSQAAEASLSMVYTNAMGDELPFSIFSKHGWAPDPKARFVKLHMYFDQPIRVKEVAVEPCKDQLDSPISMFVNFDSWIWNPDQSQSLSSGGEITAKEVGRMQVVSGMDKEEMRSLTINFNGNSGFSICDIHLKDPEGEEYFVQTPDVVSGSVAASSTLSPATAYAPIYLFDSRFEYGWASNKKAKNVDLTFDFDVPKRVERIRIWNGYQRSVKHCIANSRVKTLHITGDGGYEAQVTVKDALGSQVIQLPKPFEGKHLKFTVVDSFRGKSYADLVISELRFYDGKNWFMLDPSEKLKQNIADNRAKFAQAGVQAMLNDSYVSDASSDVVQKPHPMYATLRLRADGSFFFSSGNEFDSYFALGNYEIKQSSKAKGLTLRLFGLIYHTRTFEDCNGCGRDCNKIDEIHEGDAGVDRIQNIFQQTVTLRSSGLVTYKLETVGKDKMGFELLEFTRER